MHLSFEKGLEVENKNQNVVHERSVGSVYYSLNKIEEIGQHGPDPEISISSFA